MGGRVFCGGGWALNPQGFVEAALSVEVLNAGQLTSSDLAELGAHQWIWRRRRGQPCQRVEAEKA